MSHLPDVTCSPRKKYRSNDEDGAVYGMTEATVLGFENLFFPFAWLALGTLLAVPLVLAETIARKMESRKLKSYY